ncbi:MAG: type II secretion system F family protein [Acidobacteria bacterium]|nr:type II secretion system F family protein [Acidobacteriota bacterium]
MLSLILFVLMFVGAFLTALLAASFQWAYLYVRERRSGVPLDDGLEEPGANVLKDDDLSTIRVWADLLERFSHMEELRRLISEANLNWTVGRATLMMLLAASSTALLLSQVPFVPSLMAAALALMAGSIPYFYIRHLRNRRFRAFASQFPEALDSLTRALKAGYPISSAMELLAMEQPEPLATEMRRTRDQWNLGTGWDQALDQLAARIPLIEVAVFVAAVKMQNKAGGRLNDVLARLGETMRDNSALESEIRSVSAHSRISGLILSVLPVVIGVLMFLVAPEYMGIMFRRPEGRTILMVAVVANITAHFVIKRLSQVRT